MRGQVGWCGQCYLPLPSPEPTPAPEPALLRPPVPSSPGPAGHGPTWPCPCGGANPLEQPACSDCGAVFLSRLRTEQTPSLVLPLVGDVARFSRGQRMAGACGVALALSLGLLLLGLLLSRG